MYRGFPVIQDKQDMTLVGYIGRSELMYLLGMDDFVQADHKLIPCIDKAKTMNKAHASTLCQFKPDDDESREQFASISSMDYRIQGSSEALDFGPYIDQVGSGTQIIRTMAD